MIVPNPCPENLNKVRRLDDFLTDNIRDKKRTQEHSLEALMEKTKSKILEVMGPLSKVWLAFDAAKDGENPADKKGTPTVEQLLQLTEQSILLLGQTSNFLTYERKNALSCIYSNSQVATTLKEKTNILKESDKNLFGKQFRDQVIEASKAKKEESLKAESETKKSSAGGATRRSLY